MLSSHLTLALRALRRDAGYALLNGVGLTVALACCVLIGLYARAELSFDRHHPEADRLVMMATSHLFGLEQSESTSTPYPLHVALRDEVPAAEAALLLSMGGAETPVLRPGEPVEEARVIVASASFADVLGPEVLAGDPAAALASPDRAVLTEGAARRLFGGVDVVGRPFRTEARRDTQDVTVGAVVADPPRTASIDYEVVLPVLAIAEDQRRPDSWGQWQWMTLARLAPGASVADLDAQLVPVVEAAYGTDDPARTNPRYFGVPLVDYHLSDLSRAGGFLGDPRYLGLFSGAALLVLLLGMINYVNLATARAARRAREVGVRKALGAGRAQIAGQFLAEAVVLTVLSGAVALGLAALALPAFNEGFGTELALADLDLGFVAAALAAAVAVGLLAGAYPAGVLARFDPAVVLRGASSRSGRPSRNVLRRALVAVQFAVAIGLVAGTAVVLQQIRYTSATDLGFVADGVVAVPMKPGRGPAAPWRAAADAFRRSASVAAVVPADEYPGSVRTRFTFPLEGSETEFMAVAPINAEPGYLDLLGIELVAGRDVRDTDDAALVNEAFVETVGWDGPEAALGETVSLVDEVPIVGVVEDFHFASMRSEVEPAVILQSQSLDGGEATEYAGVLVRFAPGAVEAGLADLRRIWDGLGTGQPFEPEFVDESVAEMYEADRRLAGVLGGFALVAVVVACLGLVGLAAYTAQRRTREIGVRRALGATVGQVVRLLSREYAALVAVGAVVAVPAAVLLLDRWLDGFAYHVPLGPGLFVAAVALTLALALAVVGVQAARAARVPPTESLRAD